MDVNILLRSVAATVPHSAPPINLHSYPLCFPSTPIISFLVLVIERDELRLLLRVRKRFFPLAHCPTSQHFSMRPEHAQAADHVKSLSILGNSAASSGTGRGSASSFQQLQDITARRSGSNDYESLKTKYLRDLDPQLPLDQRISAAHGISREVGLFSHDTFLTALTVAEDLTLEDAPLKARKAGYALLRAFASLSESLSEREKLYTMIITPIAPSKASLQISALCHLTRNGVDLSPFEADLVVFLNSSLGSLSLAATSARGRQHEENLVKNRPSRETSSVDNVGRDTLAHSHELLGEVKSLRDMFYLLSDIITHNPRAFDDAQLEILLAQVTSIARRTTSKKDLHGVVKVLRAITEHAHIPESSLLSCIHVLLTIYGIPKIGFNEELWGTLCTLLRSSHKQILIKVLLDTLANPSSQTETNEMVPKIRGTLSTLSRIAEDDSLAHLLTFHLHQLVSGLCSLHTMRSQLEYDLLITVNALLSSEDVVRLLPHSVDWDILSGKLDEIEVARKTRSTRNHQKQEQHAHNVSSPFRHIILSHEGGNRKLTENILVELSRMAERIVSSVPSHWHNLSRQRLIIVTRALVNIAFYVPLAWENAARLMWDQGLLRPSEDWTRHLVMLLDEILVDPIKPEGPRCCVIRLCSWLFKELRLDIENKAALEHYMSNVCKKLAHEENLPASIVDCIAEVTSLCGPDVSNDAFNDFLTVIENGSELLPTDRVTSGQISEQAVDCLIKSFLKCLPESAMKTCHVYKVLLSATAPKNPTGIRLKVMKLFTRLRCDSREALQVVLFPDTQGLAGVLCRREVAAIPPGSKQTRSTRSSLHDQFQLIRQTRSSVVDVTKIVRSRSATRSSNLRQEYLRPNPPLWMYDGSTKDLPEDPWKGPSQVVHSSPPSQTHPIILDISSWLDVMIRVLDQGGDWELYSYVLVHLPSQLSNRSLCARYVRQLQSLHNLVLDQLEKSSFHRPPQYSNMKMGDVALCLYHILTMLISYHELFGRRELDNAVRAFLAGVNKWDRVGKCCIHALALCCHEIPSVIDRYIFAIIQKMSQKITQSDLAVDILEFLCGLARLPEACSSATSKIPDSSGAGDDGTFYKKVFGICISYISSTREQRQRSSDDTESAADVSLTHQGGTSGVRAYADLRGDLPEYVYNLAYHVIIFWFLSIDLSQRAQHVGWLAKELAWKDLSGNDVLEEQSQVILDMMHRTAYSNLGETEPARPFVVREEIPITKTWLIGMSIVTIEFLPSQNLGQYTKRQASGTTHALYHHHTARLPEHHVRDHNNAAGLHDIEQINDYPNHMFLQLSSTIAPVPIPLQPVVLPDDDFTNRALNVFDKTDTVDGHKIGLIYVGEGQCNENEILANRAGTEAYEAFLSGLGTAVRLQGARFNTQGLDRNSNIDGTHTYAWRDRVTEIVFHVATMMPTDLGNDPHCDNKKRHIGNDRVKIIYNDSGQELNFEVINSAYNDVNIMVSPEAHQQDGRMSKRRRAQNAQKEALMGTDLFGFYKVQALCSSNFPQLSPAATPKIVSVSSLPAYVRQIALNASVCAQVWSEVIGQGQYASTWLARLRQINRLREKYGNTQTSANVSYPMPTHARAYVDGNDWLGRVAMGGLAERDQLLMGLDFTRWT